MCFSSHSLHKTRPIQLASLPSIVLRAGCSLPSGPYVESSWNVMAHGDAREGKWRGNRRMEWVASTLHTTSERGVSSITTADAHTSAASSRLNWRPPADLNGLVRFAERRNLVSARVPSYFKRSLALFHFSHDRSSWSSPSFSSTFQNFHIHFWRWALLHIVFISLHIVLTAKKHDCA